MIQWIIWLIAIYITYYTYSYGKLVYKEGNKMGGIAVYLLAVLTIVLPYLINFK